MVEITYQGPASAYEVEHDGEWYALLRGAGTSVPDELAERLGEVEGHTFTTGVDVTPAAAKLAAEFDIDLDTVTPTGHDGRQITKSDVEAAHEAAQTDPQGVNETDG